MGYDNWKCNAPDPGTVSDPKAEQLFREAAEMGARVAVFLQDARDGIECERCDDECANDAITWATDAASLYHEALRESGECPECGEALPVYDFILNGERYAPCSNCREPQPTFEGELAKKWPGAA